MRGIKNKEISFQAGYNAAKNGDSINNYPYVKGNGYWDWLDGYRSYSTNVSKNNSKMENIKNFGQFLNDGNK